MVVRACRLLLTGDKPTFSADFITFTCDFLLENESCFFGNMKIAVPPQRLGSSSPATRYYLGNVDKDEALQKVLKWHSDVLSKREQFAAREVEQLAPSGADSDFKQLCGKGCVPEILAILVAFLRWSPNFDDLWVKLYGNPNDRRRVRRNLEKTAKAIEGLFSLLISLEDEKTASQAAELGRIPLGRLASELRFYASILDLFDRIPRETETRSLSDFGKFLLTEYVKQVTRHFRDRNVSALIAETVGPTEYFEAAHKMWRSRNFKRMSTHFQELSELLSAIHALAVAGNVTDSRGNN